MFGEGSGDERYSLKKMVGSGGQGTVWVAADVIFGGHVAIKLLNKGTVADEDFLQRALLEEAKLQARLSNEKSPHPNIVYIIDVRNISDSIAIVMEYVEGDSVASLIGPRNQRRNVPLEQAAEIVLQVCEGLAAAHQLGIIHRDIKPPNLLVRKVDKTVKIIDWGVAKNIDLAGGSGTYTGTPPYMSPEVTRRRYPGGSSRAPERPVDVRADIYSLGVTLFQMLTGQLPFDPENGDFAPAILRGVGPRQRKTLLEHGFDAKLVDAVLRSMALDAAERFATPADFRSALVSSPAVRDKSSEARIASEIKAAWKLQQQEHDVAGAEKSFRVILAHYPSHPDAFLELARFFIQTAREDDAIATLSKGIDIVPNVSSFYNMRGRLYAKRNSPLARPDLEKALALGGLSERDTKHLQLMISRLGSKLVR